MRYVVTLEAAITRLRTFFPDPTKEAISVNELYVNAGRDLENIKENKTWLKNQLYYLKQYKFIRVQYEKKAVFPRLHTLN